MTTTPLKRPNMFFLGLSGLVAGAGFACWFMLFYFISKWNRSGPDAPSGDYIYAHVERGGLTYFNAIQSTASHLSFPLMICMFAAGAVGSLAYGENPFSRSRAPLMPGVVFVLTGAVIAVVAICFYGHDILNMLATTAFGPANDNLAYVSKD